MKCGREPGGANVSELGVCPAAVNLKAHGINGGRFGGRSCWAIPGTLCWGVVQGGLSTKLTDCYHCDFYQEVKDELGSRIIPVDEIVRRLGADQLRRAVQFSEPLSPPLPPAQEPAQGAGDLAPGDTQV